jgi:hypothetical protein
VEYVANIRYTMNEVVVQAERVHTLVSGGMLDFETIKLNVDDMGAKMDVAKGELKDLSATLTALLEVPDAGSKADL